MICTTLKAIKEHSPCSEGWKKLLKHLGKTKCDEEPLPLVEILKSNGLDDAIWCLRSVDHKSVRLYAVACAREVQHLMTDARSLKALDVAEAYANGQATEEELEQARNAACDATDAACDATDAAYAAPKAAGDAAIAAYYAAKAACDATNAAYYAAKVANAANAYYAACDAANAAYAAYAAYAANAYAATANAYAATANANAAAAATCDAAGDAAIAANAAYATHATAAIKRQAELFIQFFGE